MNTTPYRQASAGILPAQSGSTTAILGVRFVEPVLLLVSLALSVLGVTCQQLLAPGRQPPTIEDLRHKRGCERVLRVVLHAAQPVAVRSMDVTQAIVTTASRVASIPVISNNGIEMSLLKLAQKSIVADSSSVLGAPLLA